MASRAVEHTDRWVSVDGTGSAPVTLVYDPADPYAITADFGDDNKWCFARTLLIDGLDRFVGYYGGTDRDDDDWWNEDDQFTSKGGISNGHR